jgi:pyruvate dehydrogenase E2 component (dihydrolipoamide acetyltransferase)
MPRRVVLLKEGRALAKMTLTVPKLGLTMTSARLVEWTRKVGDAVAAGQSIGSLEIDKAVHDIEVPFDCTVVELLAAPDPEREYDIGTPLAIIEERHP